MLCMLEMTQKMNEMLKEADKNSADYENSEALSRETSELLGRSKSASSAKTVDESKTRKETAKYLYGVIPRTRQEIFGNMGMDDRTVYTVCRGSIAGVVSDSVMKDYELTEENLRKHEGVLRQLMEDHTVVPVEFGTIIRNERILRSLLTKAYDPIRECLRLVHSKIELGVKAVVDGDTALPDLGRRKEYTSEILASLGSMARQVVTGELFSHRLILNASFLVNRTDIDAFSEGVAELRKRCPELRLLYSGPWPPYSFVYIKIGRQGIEITRNK